MPASNQPNSRLIAPTTLRMYDAQAPVNSDVIEPGPASLLGFIANNKSASTLYLMFFDSTTVPTNGTVPKFCPIPLTQNTPVNVFLNDVPAGSSMIGVDFGKGLSFAVSTTSDTLTVDASNSVWLTARYQR